MSADHCPFCGSPVTGETSRIMRSVYAILDRILERSQATTKDVEALWKTAAAVRGE